MPWDSTPPPPPPPNRRVYLSDWSECYNHGTGRIGKRIASIVITLTQDKATPLITACVFGSAATVRVLLEHGASVDLCNEVRDLHYAHTI